MPLIRAVTLTWLFSGLRSDELSRLRVGCVRWQHDGAPIAADARGVTGHRRRLPDRRARAQDRDRVHQTRRSDSLGQAIPGLASLARPAQPKATRLTAKACEHVDMLFAVRGQPVARSYINRTIIPHCAPRPALPHQRRAAAGSSPATVPAPPSPASSTTPRSR